MDQKRVIFISNSTYPSADAGGGSVVVFRHLSRLENEGYQILVINMATQRLIEAQKAGRFKVINLEKSWWFPPLRKSTPALTALRIKLYGARLRRQLKMHAGPDIFLGLLGEFSNLLIENLHRKYQIPYLLFYHDDTLFNRYVTHNLMNKKQIDRILKSSAFIFSVSDALNELLKKRGIRQSETLYPIPEAGAYANLSVNIKTHPATQFFISGMIEAIHFDLIRKIAAAVKERGGELSVIRKWQRKPDDFPMDHIKPVNRFETVRELFSCLRTSADVLLVFYSFDPEHEPRMLSSFPSKFLEYCQVGLPIMIVAPAYSTLGQWAADFGWLSYVDTDHHKTLSEMIKKLGDPEFRTACANQAIECAGTQFDPENIHRQFSARLETERTRP